MLRCPHCCACEKVPLYDLFVIRCDIHNISRNGIKARMSHTYTVPKLANKVTLKMAQNIQADAMAPRKAE